MVCILLPVAFESCTGQIVALRCNKQFVQEVTAGQKVGILLNKTNFYAEQGGQMYDTGFMSKCDDEVINYINSLVYKFSCSYSGYKRHNTFSCSLFCGPYGTMVIHFYLLARMTLCQRSLSHV